MTGLIIRRNGYRARTLVIASVAIAVAYTPSCFAQPMQALRRMPRAALSQISVLTCNGAIAADYVIIPGGNDAIDGETTARIRITLGAYDIAGGSVLSVPALFVDLDCNPSSADDCADVGPVVSYAGDDSISTTCAGTFWMSNNPTGGPTPNEVVFIPSEPIRIPAETQFFCDLEFDVRIDAARAPEIEQRVGFATPAECDNGAYAAATTRIVTGESGAASCNGPMATLSYRLTTSGKADYTARVHLDLGTEAIEGGASLSFSELSFDLDCDAGSAPGTCRDLGAIISYRGDSTITTTCAGGVWTSNSRRGAEHPNHLVFVSSQEMTIPANAASFCSLEFDVSIKRAIGTIQLQQRSIVGGLCDNQLTAVRRTTYNVRITPDERALRSTVHRPRRLHQ